MFNIFVSFYMKYNEYLVWEFEFILITAAKTSMILSLSLFYHFVNIFLIIFFSVVFVFNSLVIQTAKAYKSLLPSKHLFLMFCTKYVPAKIRHFDTEESGQSDYELAKGGWGKMHYLHF